MPIDCHIGRSDLGGKQSWRPEHNGLTAAPKWYPEYLADLVGKESIEPGHVSEAIQYRTLDRNFWA